MVLMKRNFVEGFWDVPRSSTVDERFFRHVQAVYVLIPITCCDVVIAEDLHYGIVVNKTFYDLISGDEGKEPRHVVDASLGTILLSLTWEFRVRTCRL